MLNIIKATYGDVDCTHEVTKHIVNDMLVIKSGNNIIGDTAVGIVKYLNIEWNINDGEVQYETVREGDFIRIPKSKNNRLAIFYSNNNNNKIWPAIYKSLDTIRIASEDIADVITCTWVDLPDNPFYNVPSWYTSQSHLNQLLQILQCLYTAKETGQYKYVSFCEHDVMYPKEYFNYPDFNSGEVLTNMNYGGLCKDGWQKRTQDDEPFHQMTMLFDDAIKHCEYILPNAIRTNSGMVEPQQTMTRIQWECINQAIHINHGMHFTSHNTIYSKTDITPIHEYWGDYMNYQNLLNLQS